MRGLDRARRNRGRFTFANSYADSRVSDCGIIHAKLEFLSLDIFLESHNSGPVNALIYGVITYRLVDFTCLGRFFLWTYESSHSIGLIGELERGACRAALSETELCRHWSKCSRGDGFPSLAETSDNNV